MEAIDTNVLVRYLTADNTVQFNRAIEVIESGSPKLLSPIVLTELSWVLKSVYGLDRESIVGLLRLVGSNGFFMYKRPEAIKIAIEEYAAGFDLADTLIGRLNMEDGAETTFTFDKKAGKLPGYRAIS